MKSDQDKLDRLREQIEMRTRRLQWVEFKTKWSSKDDEDVGTVPELMAHVKEILGTERERRAANELPDVAQAPIMKRKTYTRSSARQRRRRRNSPASAQSSLPRSCWRRRSASVCGLRRWARSTASVTGNQRVRRPSKHITPLLGKMIEVRWHYYLTEGGQRKQVYIWCTGEMVEVADSKTTKKSTKCKSPLPWGAVQSAFGGPWTRSLMSVRLSFGQC